MPDDLLTIALIGTARSTNVAVSLPATVSDAVSRVEDPAAEQKLLTHALLVNAYRRGAQPAQQGELPAPSDVDELPACSPVMADLLSDLIRSGSKELVVEWLSAASGARRRVPHRVLPDVLTLASKEKYLRGIVGAVIDRRGRWLMSHNPDWSFTVESDALDESIWDTGTLDERSAVLRQTRTADPSCARELLLRSWKDDPADERAEFLKLLSAGLSMEDESFLESLLDDRSKQVRVVAADLLSRMPASQLVRRMVARVSPLLTFNRGLLKGVKLDVSLPTELDKSAERDGVVEAAPTGVGEKQWWLRQMVSFVPPALWTKESGLTPTDVIAAVAKSEFADVLLAGLVSAAERHPDPVWLDPLLRHAFEQDGRLVRTLLSVLPASQLMGLAVDVLRHKRVGLNTCSDLINNDNVPLDLRTSKLWVQTVAQLATRASREEWSALYYLPTQCATRLAPGVRDDIELLWLSQTEPWSHYRNGVDKLLKIMDVRLQIQKEFQT